MACSRGWICACVAEARVDLTIETGRPCVCHSVTEVVSIQSAAVVDGDVGGVEVQVGAADKATTINVSRDGLEVDAMVCDWVSNHVDVATRLDVDKLEVVVASLEALSPPLLVQPQVAVTMQGEVLYVGQGAVQEDLNVLDVRVWRQTQESLGVDMHVERQVNLGSL